MLLVVYFFCFSIRTYLFLLLYVLISLCSYFSMFLFLCVLNSLCSCFSMFLILYVLASLFELICSCFSIRTYLLLLPCVLVSLCSCFSMFLFLYSDLSVLVSLFVAEKWWISYKLSLFSETRTQTLLSIHIPYIHLFPKFHPKLCQCLLEAHLCSPTSFLSVFHSLSQIAKGLNILYTWNNLCDVCVRSLFLCSFEMLLLDGELW